MSEGMRIFVVSFLREENRIRNAKKELWKSIPLKKNSNQWNYRVDDVVFIACNYG